MSPKIFAISISSLVFSGAASRRLVPSSLSLLSGLQMGSKTPHSQFRQFSFGCLVDLSMTGRPLQISYYYKPFIARETEKRERTYQALSDRLALPTYAQAVQFDPSGRMNFSSGRTRSIYIEVVTLANIPKNIVK